MPRKLGSRSFHTGGFRNPLPSLPWTTAALCCISLMVEPPRARGSSLQLAVRIAPGPGWAISWGVCVLYTFLPSGCGNKRAPLTRSWRSPPLAIHHLFQRFPECSPLTTGDFGCTSKAACWEERAGLWRPQVWGRRRPLSRDCPLRSPPAARGHRRPLRDSYRRSSWALFCLTAGVPRVALHVPPACQLLGLCVLWFCQISTAPGAPAETSLPHSRRPYLVPLGTSLCDNRRTRWGLRSLPMSLDRCVSSFSSLERQEAPSGWGWRKGNTPLLASTGLAAE